jgi:ABC-type oligopeptide transport system substrate-binding subunit
MKTSKSLYTILALALVMVFVLAACAPAATQAPAEEPAADEPQPKNPPLASGAPAPKSSSSLVEHQVVALNK